MQLLRTKSIEDSIRDTEEGEFRLNRALGPVQLIVFGIGVIVGAGIFVLTGLAAATAAGPAIAISFVLSGIACALAALCYAEFASTVPVAGSAYTFSYASLGELVAWIIGWDLILEFAVGAATVAIGWSKYFAVVLGLIGVKVTPTLAFGLPANLGGTGAFNWGAALIVLLLTLVLVLGIRLSSGVTTAIVLIKLAVIAVVIAVGIFFIKTANWSPFIPAPSSAPAVTGGGGLDSPLITLVAGIKQTAFGISGVVAAAALVFFAYIGFDIVATTAEETKNPQRDLPIGIVGSLAVVTVLYIAVSLVITGMVPYKELNSAAPVATAFQKVGQSQLAGWISVGALAGLTSVIMILMLGQSRIFFAMSRDHLLPPVLARVHRTFRTPWIVTVIVGLVIALVASLFNLAVVADMVNIGTLSAFILVAVGVLVLRRTRPDLPRAFRTPLVPVVPVLAAVACLYLALNLTALTWLRFVAWMVIGLVIYFAYSYRHSRVRRGEPVQRVAEEARGRPVVN